MKNTNKKKQPKTYTEFWDKFNIKLYQEVVEDRGGRIDIRLEKKARDLFEKNCQNKGGMTKVLTTFINQVNRISNE